MNDQLKQAAFLPKGDPKRREILKKLKKAGLSYAIETGWFSFVGGKTPFNVDMIRMINNTVVPFISAEDEPSQIDLQYVRSMQSPPLTRLQELEGLKPEVVFQVKFPKGASKATLAALTKLGKQYRFQVSALPNYREPQTKRAALDGTKLRDNRVQRRFEQTLAKLNTALQDLEVYLDEFPEYGTDTAVTKELLAAFAKTSQAKLAFSKAKDLVDKAL